jgi:hypothetical protein
MELITRWSLVQSQAAPFSSISSDKFGNIHTLCKESNEIDEIILKTARRSATDSWGVPEVITKQTQSWFGAAI